MALVLINEIDVQTADDDKSEFIELYDGGRGFTNLAGKTVVLFSGATNQAYAVFELEGYTTGPNGYFLIGRDSVEPVPNISLIEPTIQNEMAAVALYDEMAGRFTIGSSITTENLLDAVVYGEVNESNIEPNAELLTLLIPNQMQINEAQNDEADTESIQRCPNGFGLSRATSEFYINLATPKQENACGFEDTDDFAGCGQIARPIHSVQGRSAISPIDGFRKIVVEGIVVGDFQDPINQLGGFFLQEESFHFDTDPLTSEGIFIFTNGQGVDVSEGDIVRVQGDLQEFANQTRLANIAEMEICGRTTEIKSIDIRFPVDDPKVWEQYEGMLVEFPQTLYVTDNYDQGTSGVIELSAFSRLTSPTNIASPGADANAVQSENNRYRILLDDGSILLNPTEIPYLNQEGTLRVGDAVSRVVGVVDYRDRAYHIQPVDPPLISIVNKRPNQVPTVGGTMTVASFNLGNYFNGDGVGGGFPTLRGAGTPNEFMRQSAKVINTLAGLDADIVGLIEIENDEGPNSAIADLVSKLNQSLGTDKYSYIDTGIIGENEIRVALIYQSNLVQPVGNYQVLNSSIDQRFLDDYNRPSLVQAFQDLRTGKLLTVVVNHLKSRNFDCNERGDFYVADGQGNCSATRTNASRSLIRWLNQNPTRLDVPNTLIIGELNAYAKEDAVEVILQAGYTDLLQAFLGVTAYTNVSDGQTGYLDYALANESLLPKITGIAEWHINADEPRAMGYSDSNQSNLYQPNVFRSSDHDPILVGIDMGETDYQGKPTNPTYFLPIVIQLDRGFK